MKKKNPIAAGQPDLSPEKGQESLANAPNENVQRHHWANKSMMVTNRANCAATTPNDSKAAKRASNSRLRLSAGEFRLLSETSGLGIQRQWI